MDVYEVKARSVLAYRSFAFIRWVLSVESFSSLALYIFLSYSPGPGDSWDIVKVIRI